MTTPVAPPATQTMPVFTEATLDGKCPTGPIESRWDRTRFEMKLVNPSNRRKFRIIMVGSGLAGAAAAASLGEAGYNVDCFCYQDSPRRAHSVAAQGGINAAKNYRNDGDSVYRLFYDTVKGGDFRAREANVYRLAEVSNDIIDQCVAQGVPFAREYGGMLDNRSFGGAQVARTFYARGQTGQQLLLGAYQALQRQIAAKTVTMYTRTEMLDLIVVNGRARGIVTRDMRTGEIKSHMADVVVLATGGYSNVFYLSTNAKGCNTTAIWRSYKRGALLCQPLLYADSPHLHPPAGEHQSKLTLMSESLRNDGRIWVPRKPDETRPVDQIPEEDRYYYLEEMYPSYGNLAPRDISSRAAKRQVDARAGRRPAEERRLPGLCRFDQAPGREGHPRPLRQPLRHVRKHHGRERLQGAHAHLPGPALHDGRPVGGLRPGEHDPGPLCAGRGQLLRPRRQPPGRQRADAGAGRRLLRPALHPAQLPGLRPSWRR